MKHAPCTLLVVALLLPVFVSADTITVGFTSVSGGYSTMFGTSCVGTLACIGQLIIETINRVLVPVLFAVAFIVFLYGVAKAYIISAGDEEEVKKGHKLILWGLIAFAVMISIWGLVSLVVNTFGLAGVGSLPPPASPYGTSG